MNELSTAVEPETLRIERMLPGPLERVWRYLTDSELRGQWFASGTMELRPGGAMELKFNHAALSAVVEEIPEKYKTKACGAQMGGTITVCEPPNRLGFTFGPQADPSEVLIELSERDGQVHLQLTHWRLTRRGERLSVAAGWHLHLDYLADRLHGRTSGPFWSRHSELEAFYADRLDLRDVLAPGA